MKKVITSILLISTLLLCSCTKYKLQGQVDATVTKKDYSASYTVMIPMSSGNNTTIMIPQVYPEEYNVELQYKNCTTTLDSEELYNKVQTNDKVKVNYYISEDGKKERISHDQ
jgi:serine protease inhibitor ecotin